MEIMIIETETKRRFLRLGWRSQDRDQNQRDSPGTKIPYTCRDEGLSRKTRVSICPDTFCVPLDRDWDRSLRDKRERDKKTRNCPVTSFAHPWSELQLTGWIGVILYLKPTYEFLNLSSYCFYISYLKTFSNKFRTNNNKINTRKNWGQNTFKVEKDRFPKLPTQKVETTKTKWKNFTQTLTVSLSFFLNYNLSKCNVSSYSRVKLSFRSSFSPLTGSRLSYYQERQYESYCMIVNSVRSDFCQLPVGHFSGDQSKCLKSEPRKSPEGK